MANKFMIVGNTPLSSVTKKIAGALSVKETVDGTAFTDARLPNQALRAISEYITRENPLAAYSNINVTSTGTGGIEVEFDIDSGTWTESIAIGEGTESYEALKVGYQNFNWRKPAKIKLGVKKAELDRGAVNSLARRMAKKMTKTINEMIKEGFKNLVDKSKKVTLTALDFTSRDKITEFKINFFNEITDFVNKNDLSSSDVVVTLEPKLFNVLVEHGMIGDHATKSFVTGIYGVGTIDGFRVQSGSIFLPSTSNDGTADKEVYAFVGIDQSAAFQTSITAANIGALGLSNDLGMFLEMAFITGAIDYQTFYKKDYSLTITVA